MRDDWLEDFECYPTPQRMSLHIYHHNCPPRDSFVLTDCYDRWTMRLVDWHHSSGDNEGGHENETIPLQRLETYRFREGWGGVWTRNVYLQQTGLASHPPGRAPCSKESDDEAVASPFFPPPPGRVFKGFHFLLAMFVLLLGYHPSWLSSSSSEGPWPGETKQNYCLEAKGNPNEFQGWIIGNLI